MLHIGYFCEWINSYPSPTAAIFLSISCDSLFSVSYATGKEEKTPHFLVVIHSRKHPFFLFFITVILTTPSHLAYYNISGQKMTMVASCRAHADILLGDNRHC